MTSGRGRLGAVARVDDEEPHPIHRTTHSEIRID